MEINASDFKARCLALLDEVFETGEEITILKRGKPVARVVAAPRENGSYPQDGLSGSVRILGDVLSPVVDPSDWDANRGRL